MLCLSCQKNISLIHTVHTNHPRIYVRFLPLFAHPTETCTWWPHDFQWQQWQQRPSKIHSGPAFWGNRRVPLRTTSKWSSQPLFGGRQLDCSKCLQPIRNYAINKTCKRNQGLHHGKTLTINFCNSWPMFGWFFYIQYNLRRKSESKSLRVYGWT